jgi:class 3 adenylate cyclase/Tfp pilus assembly protein PilF
MNYETLKVLLTQAEKLNKSGNFNAGERLAKQVLAEFEKASVSPESGTLNEVETLYCITLLTLADSARLKGDYDSSLVHARASLSLAVEHNLPQSKAKAQHAIGNVYKDLGSYDKALEYFHIALATAEALGEKSGVAIVTGNIGIVYMSLGSYDKALEYYHKALAAHEELGTKLGAVRVTQNIGIVYAYLGSYDKALEYFHKALATHEELGDKSSADHISGNIGNVYQSLGSYDKALEYYHKALATAEALGAKSSVAIVTGNIGSLFAEKKYEGYDAAKAEKYLLKSIAISTEIGAKHHLFSVHESLSELYENEEQWKEHSVHYKKYIEIRDEVNAEEVKKQDEQRERDKQIAIAIAAADAKHQATQELLHNVLPPSIAHRMIAGEKLIAEKLPSVSVMFADIVNFTKLSQRITPEELVDGLDRIFSEFDRLAEKHGLEKIKTIGDAYMVVSGAPVQRENHAEVMAHFALEMLEAMKQFHSISTGEEIQLRIGIHSGEVVAGVIGKKKFAYHMWGDAVNTASRMESHGEAGKIHVSEEFMHALSLSSLMSFKSFHFQERVEMEIKGKGKMKTYFLEKA